MNNTNKPQNNNDFNEFDELFGETTPVRQNLANRSGNAQPTRPATQGTSGSQPPRRPMNNEERRRLEAARQAAMRGGNAPQTTPKPAASGQAPQVNRPKRPAPLPPSETQPYTAAPQRKTTPGGEYVRDYQDKQPSRNNSTPKKRKKLRINWGMIIFVVIIIAVVGWSIHYITNNPHTPGGNLPSGNETGEGDLPVDTGDTGNESDEPDTTVTEPEVTEPEPPKPFGFTVSVSNENIDVGNLILVNYEHPYARVDSVKLTNVRANKESDLQVSAMDDALAHDAFLALDKMTADLREIGCGDWVLLTSGYRDVAEQQGIWDRNLAQSGEEYTKNYVAVPGHSEHHTGLAADLSFFTYSYASIPVADHEFGPWLWENCDDYGFILRYPEDKTHLTHIAYEAWHFRYVGIPHAKAISHLGLCYEEYIDFLRGYTTDTMLLHIKSDGTVTDMGTSGILSIADGWITYFVPMSEGDTTEIHLPFAEDAFNYEISGNNADGFIVTVFPK